MSYTTGISSAVMNGRAITEKIEGAVIKLLIAHCNHLLISIFLITPNFFSDENDTKIVIDKCPCGKKF